MTDKQISDLETIKNTPRPEGKHVLSHSDLSVGNLIYNGERYKLIKAELSHKTGEVGGVLSDNLEIACKDGSIKVLEIQKEGKRPQKINEFMHGSQIKKGSNLNNA